MGAAVSRHHIDVAGRRVHLRRCGSGPPVLLLHESPRSSAALLGLMAQAPAGVSVLALDTPGNGLSAALQAARPTADDHGDALAATMDALGIARAAVYGRHSGAAFGSALALRHPQRVARLVLDGVSAFTRHEQDDMLAGYLPPFVPLADGTHMAWLWSRVRDQALFFPWHRHGSATRLWQPLPAPAALQAVAMDLLLAGDGYRAPYRAAIGFDAAAALPGLQVVADVACRAGDVLHPHLARLPPLPAQVRVHTLPDDRGDAARRLWQWLVDGTDGLADAPQVADAALPSSCIGDTLAGGDGRRWHLRGATGGAGRPLVVLHPSPGGARGMDRWLEPHVGIRPVLGVDLPHHGESDGWDAGPVALREQLADLLHGLGLRDAEVQGEGLGAALALALGGRRPGAIATPAECASAPPGRWLPRADGGHLLAAWLHARDDAVLGGWWTRRPQSRHDFGAVVDLALVQARCLEVLKESDGAARMRLQWLAAARRGSEQRA